MSEKRHRLVIPKDIKKEDWVLIKDMNGLWLEDVKEVEIMSGDLPMDCCIIREKCFQPSPYKVKREWLQEIKEPMTFDEWFQTHDFKEHMSIKSISKETWDACLENEKLRNQQ